jgi:predicted nucleic acid-binding Zn ribbon protein
MSKRENDTNKLKDLIPQMLQENKLQKGMDQIYVKEAWLEVMGKGVANYTESVSMKNQTIFVKLSSAALREELQYGQDKIVKMMDEALGQIKVSAIKWV